MSMLKEERKALRDELERLYGIHLREDDEFLPIIHFISNASKLADAKTTELNKILEEMKGSSRTLFSKHESDYSQFLSASKQILVHSLNESKQILGNAKKDIEGLPKMVSEFRNSINHLKIPTQITVQKIAFENGTMNFLWKYFTISVAITIVTTGILAFWIVNLNNDNASLKSERDQLLEYYKHMKRIAPKETEAFYNRTINH